MNPNCDARAVLSPALSPAFSPIFSIVVPTFRRPEALENLLGGIRALRFPLEQIEVIVVDDSGEHLVDPVVNPFRAFFRVCVVHTSHLGPAPARQAGIDVARGKYLAFTDDDCIPGPGWLMELLAALEERPGCAAGGAVINGLPRNIWSAVSQMILDYVVAGHAAVEPEYIATCNAAFPAAAFGEVGGLDRQWELSGGEDRDLCRRWRESGRPIVIREQAAIAHYHPMTMAQFLNQQYRYGKGAGRFLRRSKAQAPRFYTGLIAYAFRGKAPHARILTGAVGLLSQAAIMAGFLAERVLFSKGEIANGSRAARSGERSVSNA